MNICIYGAASKDVKKSFIDAGELLGEQIAENNHTVVFGGGSSGMMGAVARGAYRKRGKIIGIVPKFFDVDGVLFENTSEMIYTETMRERKKMLEDKSDAFLITPGGFGTFDEFFETLTLRQLCAHRKPIAIFNVNGFYNYFIKMFEHAIENGFISPENRELYFISDNPSKILNYFNNYNPDDTEPAKFRNAK